MVITISVAFPLKKNMFAQTFQYVVAWPIVFVKSESHESRSIGFFLTENFGEIHSGSAIRNKLVDFCWGRSCFFTFCIPVVVPPFLFWVSYFFLIHGPSLPTDQHMIWWICFVSYVISINVADPSLFNSPFFAIVVVFLCPGVRAFLSEHLTAEQDAVVQRMLFLPSNAGLNEPVFCRGVLGPQKNHCGGVRIFGLKV